MKIRSFLPLALLLLSAPGWALEPPAKVALQVPTGHLSPGEASHLVLSLTGAKGEPVASVQDLQIEIQGAAGLGAPARVTIPAGSSRLEVPIRAPKPGLWQIEASSPGLASSYGLVACASGARTASPAPIPSGLNPKATAVPALPKPPKPRISSPQHHPVPGAVLESVDAVRPESVPPPPPPPKETAPPAPAPPTGHVELIAQPLKPRRTHGGWEESKVTAFWFQGDEPGTSPGDLPLNLVVQGGGDTRVAPTLLSIPGGSLRSSEATISAQRPDTARVEAWYPGGRSKAVEIDFQAPAPTRLGFVGTPRLFRGLTSVNTDLFIRLLDDEGEPVVTNGERRLSVVVQGTTGARSVSATVPPGEMQAQVPVELNRPGTYSILATAPGLRDSDPLEVRFALDWLLLASSLVGGVLGSLTRVLYRRERVWPKGIARVLALGVVSALLVLLLSLFGVLSILGDALPAAATLEKVSATSLFGALLLGFLAGLLFDKVLGRFLGQTPSRRRPKRDAPEPTQAPA